MRNQRLIILILIIKRRVLKG